MTEMVCTAMLEFKSGLPPQGGRTTYITSTGRCTYRQHTCVCMHISVHSLFSPICTRAFAISR